MAKSARYTVTTRKRNSCERLAMPFSSTETSARVLPSCFDPVRCALHCCEPSKRRAPPIVNGWQCRAESADRNCLVVWRQRSRTQNRQRSNLRPAPTNRGASNPAARHLCARHASRKRPLRGGADRRSRTIRSRAPHRFVRNRCAKAGNETGRARPVSHNCRPVMSERSENQADRTCIALLVMRARPQTWRSH